MKQHFKKTISFAFSLVGIVSKRFCGLAGISSFLFSVSTITVHAQGKYVLNQVIVLNDGNSLEVNNGTHATVGSYNPVTKVYKDFDTIDAHFGSHVIIDNGYIYVGADSLLIKYDLNTKAKLATQTVTGIREMAVWNNQILVTCGTTYSLKSYFRAYDKNTLQMVYQDTTVSFATEGIQVLNDSAYVAINDFGSGSVGKIGVVDLNGQKEKHEVDLGLNGLNPYSLFVEPTNQKIYTVNNLTWGNASVTKYDAPSTSYSNYSLNLSSGCSGSAYYLGNVYFQALNDINIGVFSTSFYRVWDSLKINKLIYGMGIDSADGYIYLGQTDYTTYGKVFVYSLYGQPIDSFGVDVGPGNFAFDVRNTTGIAEISNPVSVNVYPNPTSSVVSCQLSVGMIHESSLDYSVSVYNMLGEQVSAPFTIHHPQFTVDLNNQPNGVYLLTLQSANGTAIHKEIVKQ